MTALSLALTTNNFRPLSCNYAFSLAHVGAGETTDQNMQTIQLTALIVTTDCLAKLKIFL